MHSYKNTQHAKKCQDAKFQKQYIENVSGCWNIPTEISIRSDIILKTILVFKIYFCFYDKKTQGPLKPEGFVKYSKRKTLNGHMEAISYPTRIMYCVFTKNNWQMDVQWTLFSAQRSGSGRASQVWPMWRLPTVRLCKRKDSWESGGQQFCQVGNNLTILATIWSYW